MDIDSPREPQDMSMLANRLSLVGRYNHSLGAPGPEAERVQREFIDGFMNPLLIPGFVVEYELMIESRWPMKSPAITAIPLQLCTVPKSK